jgi:peptidoglycan/xylan/chitin deacetylase (PgdA/CDA1 family)
MGWLMKHFLKQRAERVLSSNALGRLTRYRVRGKRLILAYHGIVPQGEDPAGERALFMQQRDFAAHLAVLAEVADVAPLNEIDEIGDGRPRVAITFDDAYRGAVREGVEELVRHQMPATIFVAPGRLDNHVFWWDALSPDPRGLAGPVREYAIRSLGGVDERVRAWAYRSSTPFSDTLPEYARTATVDELHEATRHPGVTVGSHTWSHASLASLNTEAIDSEVVRSRDWLRSHFADKAIPWLAYPYGLDSTLAHLVLADASYRGAVRIVGGWHTVGEFSPFSRPRLNVPAGLSADGLRSRLLGAVLA